MAQLGNNIFGCEAQSGHGAVRPWRILGPWLTGAGPTSYIFIGSSKCLREK